METRVYKPNKQPHLLNSCKFQFDILRVCALLSSTDADSFKINMAHVQIFGYKPHRSDTYVPIIKGDINQNNSRTRFIFLIYTLRPTFRFYKNNKKKFRVISIL